MKKIILLGFVLLGVAADSALASSLYSRLGIGMMHVRDGVRAQGMGNASLALADGLVMYHLNPALLSSVQMARLQTEFSFESASVEVATGSGRFRDANFSGVGLLLPVKRGYAVALGFQPYSRVDFTLNQQGTSGGEAYEQIFSGSGGINEMYIAFAGSIGRPDATRGLRYGLSVDFYFGRIERNWRVNFANANLAPTDDKSGAYFRGTGVHGGLHWFHPRWQFGLAVRPPVDLTVETQTDFAFGAKSEQIRTSVTLPFWLGVGVGYRPSPKWQLATDFRMQRWGGVADNKRFGAAVRDSREVGTGVEWIRSNNPVDGYLKRVALRAGFCFRQLPYDDPVGEQVSERMVSAGLGLPYRRGFSRIDVAVELGKRGNLDNNPAAESIFRLSISMNGAEPWFVRGKQ